jgi:hypothetical protein
MHIHYLPENLKGKLGRLGDRRRHGWKDDIKKNLWEELISPTFLCYGTDNIANQNISV